MRRQCAQEAMTFHVEEKPSLCVNDALDVLVKLWLQQRFRYVLAGVVCGTVVGYVIPTSAEQDISIEGFTIESSDMDHQQSVQFVRHECSTCVPCTP